MIATRSTNPWRGQSGWKGLLAACVLAAGLECASAGAAPAASEPHPGWKLVWQDDFNRKELGDAWYLRRGIAQIRDGRLFLSGKGATALVDRGFAPDVRLEFTAEANPMLPPCDLSAALGSSNFW